MLHGLGGILIVVSTLAAAGVIFAFVRRAGREARAAGGGDGALAILRERYARGDLTREQFEQMRRDLG